MTDQISDARLFLPVTLGSLTLANRIAMAPLTRSRAGADGVPSPLAATYYAQRAAAGLLITEATNISAEGRGYAWTPGIFTPEQVAGWKAVTQAVHARGGRIFMQLWHTGRISHPSLQPGGVPPVAPSAIRPEGQAFTEAGFAPFETPRALSADEMPRLIEDYRRAAENAKAAPTSSSIGSFASRPSRATSLRRPSHGPVSSHCSSACGGSLSTRASSARRRSAVAMQSGASLRRTWSHRPTPLSRICPIKS